MAFSSRILSKSKQLCSSQILTQTHYQQATPVRFFAKEAAQQSSTGDEIFKNIFREMKNKFETALAIFRTEKITIAPEDPAAVAQYAKVLKTVRAKADILSEPERIKYDIQSSTEDVPDARTFLETMKDIRIKRGLVDELGAESMMMEALENVEKELKKPLMRNDKKGMALLTAEFTKMNTKLGIKKEDLPKYEEELDLKMAKAHLEELKRECVEAMETQKKREEFKDEEMPDVKTLDVRNFL